MITKIYALSSDRYVGKVILKYGGRDELREFSNQAELSDMQLDWFKQMLPMSHMQFQAFLTQYPNAFKVNVIPPDLSFEVFWEAYNKKVKKARTQRLWEAMNDSERIACLNSLSGYHYYLDKKKIAKCYPDTYLRDKRWLEDYVALAKQR
ncbi:hypothetical protein ACAW74_25785 [Fibrella sp. WM1]|uniref:hypothetical protein n=1 Tax=Fibrella musci TaxID=3242485 RepID=UPI0035229B4F